MREQLRGDAVVFMYVGNLQAYQGIDLLLESFALLLKRTDQAHLVIIGGQRFDIQKYRAKARHLAIDRQVHFWGPRPLEQLGDHLAEADILVSPRIKGKNTPMKLYSYLHSGTALLATDLPTHTQVLHSGVAMLAEPSPQRFSEAMLRLMTDEGLRRTIGQAGKKLVEEKYTYRVFRAQVNALFDWLEAQVGQGSNATASNARSCHKNLCQ